MVGFLGKTQGTEELWGVLLNVNWCVNGHCDLWKTPLWESGEVFTDLVLCPLFFFFPLQCFQKKLLPQQKCLQHYRVSDRIKVENLISPGLLRSFVFEPTRHEVLTL